MISVVIPCYKDKYVNPTMQSILDSFEGEFEIIPVLDGVEVDLIKDTRIKPLLLPERKGMRNAINKGIEAARGEYLMRSDAHCMFAKGFDTTILKDIKDNWVVDAQRRFLDPVKWEQLPIQPIEMERLIISERHNKFSAIPWRERDNDIPIKPKMAMQGSVWVMPHAWWDKVIGHLEEDGYGTLYQDSTEMTMKTWQAGGELVLNKNTWYAHKHRDFNRTHDYPNKLSRASWDHALAVWGDYYHTVVEPRWKQPFSI